MKVRFQGFNFEMRNSLSQMWDIAFPQGEWEYCLRGDNIKVRIEHDTQTNYLLGVIVRFKKEKILTTLDTTTSNGSFILSKIKPNKPLVDFNFFVLNQRTKRGIYQYYHGAIKLNSFIFFIMEHFKEKKQEYLANCTSETQKSGLKKCLLEGAICYSNESFENLISTLQNVKRIEVSANIFDSNNSLFLPDLMGHIRRQHVQILLKKNTAPQSLLRSLRLLATRSTKLRVVGQDEDALQKIIDLRDNFSDFGEMDYNNLVASLPSNGGALTDFPIIETLLQKAIASTFINSQA